MPESFDVVLDDGTTKHRFQLNRSYYGLYISPMIWRKLKTSHPGLYAWPSHENFMMKTTIIVIAMIFSVR